MSREEFNSKYKDYIQEGFENQGLMIDDDKVATFLDSVFVDFTRIPDFRFSQIKFKFGNCRFYSNLGSELTWFVEHRINELL